MKSAAEIVRYEGADLARRIRQVVERVQREQGITYIGVPDAPSDFDMLRLELNRALRTGQFRVFDGACENTIYPSAQHNMEFRFLHDLHHLSGNFDFSIGGEVSTHLALAERLFGFQPKWSAGLLPMHKVYMIDSIGQTYVSTFGNGTFVTDQRQFCVDILTDHCTNPETGLFTLVRDWCMRNTDKLIGGAA